MRRSIAGANGLAAAEDEAEAGVVVTATPVSSGRLRTEFEFELPRGYLDETGALHRRGVMRLATAKDELLLTRDDRVKRNPAYMTVTLLARVITRLGGLEDTDVNPGVVENFFASDLAFLQDMYRRINQEGHTRASVTCPSCDHEFTVDVGGGRLGEP